MGLKNYLEVLRRIFHKPEMDAVTVLRLVMGWVFLSSGLSKLAENGLQYSYASTYLSKALPVNTPEIAFSFPDFLQIPGLLLVKAGAVTIEPLIQIFSTLPFIGSLVVITELFIGFSLIFGLFMRLGSLIGSFMMVLFYYGNADWGHGLLNSDMVYLVLLLSLVALDAQEKFSLDSYISEKYEIENEMVEKVLGL